MPALLGRDRITRRTKLVALAVTVGLGVNVAAAAIVDGPSDGRRRAAAEQDLRARLARQGVRGASVSCQSGRRCTVTRGSESVSVDPRLAVPLSHP